MPQEAKPSIPWIGYCLSCKYPAKTLEERGFTVLRFYHTGEGLEELKKRPYPIILVQDWLNDTQGVNLPSGIDVTDQIDITSGVVRIIKSLETQSNAKIIVPHHGTLDYLDSRLRQAGADKFVDLMGEHSLDELVRAVEDSLLVSP